MIRIVLVNPDTTIQRNFSKWLRRLHPDISILKAAHGGEALEWLETASAHLVMTGLSMPVMDGFELLARLSERYADLPSVIFSENTDATESVDPRKVSRIGPYVFLRPPFDYSSAVAALRMALDERPTTPTNPLASFVRLLKNERRTCTVAVRSRERCGRLFFNHGILIEAEVNDMRGEPAVLTLLSAKDSTFSVGPLDLSDISHSVMDDANESSPRDSVHILPSAIPPPSPAFTPPRPPLEKWREYATTNGGTGTLSAMLEKPAEAVRPAGPTASDLQRETARKTADSFLNFADVLLSGDSDLDRVYEVVPELKLRVLKGELPQQTVSLLNLFDGKLTLRQIGHQVPNQMSALRFLVSGLASASLLKEIPKAHEPQIPGPAPVDDEPARAAETGVVPLKPVASVSLPEPVRDDRGDIPDRPYFLSSDAVLLAQTLAIKFGSVPQRAGVALWGLSQSRQPVMEDTLRHLRVTQRHHLNLPDRSEDRGPGEIGRIPFRAGLELTVHAFSNQVQTAQRIPELDSFFATILFLDSEKNLSSEVLGRLWTDYSTHFDKPCLFNLFNHAFDVQPAVIDHFAASLDLPTSLFGSWDISRPTDVTAMFARLIQVGMMF